MRALAAVAVVACTGVALGAVVVGAAPLVLLRGAEMAESWLELEGWRRWLLT